MDENRAAAYRHLLYMALVDIRNQSDHRVNASVNPIAWKRGYDGMRKSGEIADWLHNMASAASDGFTSFDEDAFWEEHRFICNRFSDSGFDRYREAFDEAAAEGRVGGASYWPPTKQG